MASLKAILSSVALCVSLSVLVSAQPTDDWVKPEFCRENDCPKYTLLNKTEEYEIREYEATTWVSVTRRNSFMVGMFNFMSLYRYIQGRNVASQKIAMTTPVTNTVTVGSNQITMSFYLPPSVNAPAPTDTNVFLQTMPKQIVYVRPFGGYARKRNFRDHKDTLADELPASVSYNSAYHFEASYNDPWTMTNRHNEIWYLAQ